MFNLSNRLEAWAERVRLRKLDNLMYNMASPATIGEYYLMREQFEREMQAKYARKVA